MIEKRALSTWCAIGLFAAMVLLSNWLIGNVGTTCSPGGPCLIPVGFGLMAPSGALTIGAALVLRDWVQETAGRGAAIAAIGAGGILSLLVAPPALAIASATAFAVSELADMAVYSRLRQRGLALAVLASGAVGAAVDSTLFVGLAFGGVGSAPGLTLAKLYASGLVAAALWVIKR